MTAPGAGHRRLSYPRDGLTDGDTTLRAWQQSDIPAVAEICQDPAIARWTSIPSPYGEADATDFVTGREPSLRAGLSVDFAIAGTATGELLGSISLMRLDWSDRRGEVGYWLAAAARGRGHATRAVCLVCHWGMRELGLERIELLAATGNVASQRVAERAGFRREAILRAYAATPEGRDDLVCFGRLSRGS